MWRRFWHIPANCRALRLCRHIFSPDTYERIASQHLRYTRRQAIKPEPHTDRLTGQIHLRAGDHRNHHSARNTDRTRRSARSLTKESTRRRVPPGRSISIIPGRSSIAGRASVPRSCGATTGLFNALFFVGLRFSESELQHFPTNRPGIAVLGIPPTRIAMTPCRATFTVAGGLPCRRSLRLSLCWPRSTIQDVPKARCIGYLTSCCLRS